MNMKIYRVSISRELGSSEKTRYPGGFGTETKVARLLNNATQELGIMRFF